MGFLGCPCYWPLGRTIWAPVLGQYQGPGRFNELTFLLGLVSEPARLFLNPISCPSALGYGEHGQGLYRFLNRVRLPRGRSGLVWLGLFRRQPSYDNDDFSTFVLTSSSSFSFFREHPLTVSIMPPLVLKLFTFLRVRASFV